MISGNVRRHVDTYQSGHLHYLPLWHHTLSPPRSLTRFTDCLVIGGSKYTVTVARSGPNAFSVTLNGSSVDVRTRKMVDGGFLMQVCAGG